MTTKIGLMERVRLLYEGPVNMGERDRIASVAVGAGLILTGIVKRSGSTPIWLALGGVMVRRGVTGKCMLYQKLPEEIRNTEGIIRNSGNQESIQ